MDNKMGSDRVMKAFLAAAAVALLEPIPAQAQIVSCKAYERTNADAPQVIRDYLERSKSSFVRACGGGDHPQYYGASSVARDGDVCRYSESELNLLRTNPPQLKRAATLQQTYMLTTKATCPSPVSTNYTATNGLPQDVFEHLIHTWRDVTASLASFDGTLSGLSDVAVVRRMRNAISKGKGNRLAVLSITLRRNFGLWKSYEMDVADPDHYDRFYAVSVSSWFGRTYAISGVSAGIY